MTRAQASEAITDILMEGDAFCKWDIAKVLDGYNVDELILLIAKGEYEGARKFLKSFVDRFMVSESGEELIDAYIRLDEQVRKDAHIDAGIDAMIERMAV